MQPRVYRTRTGQRLIQLQVPIEVDAVSPDVSRRNHHVTGQLPLDTEIPNLRLILAEVLGDIEDAETGRRGDSPAWSDGDIDRRG